MSRATRPLLNASQNANFPDFLCKTYYQLTFLPRNCAIPSKPLNSKSNPETPILCSAQNTHNFANQTPLGKSGTDYELKYSYSNTLMCRDLTECAYSATTGSWPRLREQIGPSFRFSCCHVSCYSLIANIPENANFRLSRVSLLLTDKFAGALRNSIETH